MTLGHYVSEYLVTLGLVKSYVSNFLKKKCKKSREKNLVFQRPQRMRRFACLQDCLLFVCCLFYYHSKISVVQSNRSYDLKNFVMLQGPRYLETGPSILGAPDPRCTETSCQASTS
jgi:hypothetical protein